MTASPPSHAFPLVLDFPGSPIDDAASRAIIENYLRGSISPYVALLQILSATSLGRVEEMIRGLQAAGDLVDEPDIRQRLRDLISLFIDNRERCAAIARELEEQPDFLSDAETETARVAHYSALFDGLVRSSPEASVAAYSLGSREVLDEATAEVVHLMVERGLAGPSDAILQIGCGIGRFESALSPIVGSATGIDISPGMIAEARARCAALPNVVIRPSSGLDLRLFGDALFDLVYAVDSFPYIVAVGPGLTETMFAESRRVLKPRGHFLILNFSYRQSPELDRQDVIRLAAAHGFDAVTAGETPFQLWDGSVYLLRVRV